MYLGVDQQLVAEQAENSCLPSSLDGALCSFHASRHTHLILVRNYMET